jgi:hypothetical protein
MDMGFFASYPIFFFSRDGRPKSEDRCTGKLSMQKKIKMDILSIGIIADIHINYPIEKEKREGTGWIFI